MTLPPGLQTQSEVLDNNGPHYELVNARGAFDPRQRLPPSQPTVLKAPELAEAAQGVKGHGVPSHVPPCAITHVPPNQSTAPQLLKNLIKNSSNEAPGLIEAHIPPSRLTVPLAPGQAAATPSWLTVQYAPGQAELG